MRRLPYIVPLSLALLITFVSEMNAQVTINQTEGFGEGQELFHRLGSESRSNRPPKSEIEASARQVMT